jgi:hypothetical protein
MELGPELRISQPLLVGFTAPPHPLESPTPFPRITAGAVSIATISEKTAGTKIEITPLRYMIETSVFFIVHTFAAAISVREEVLKSLTVL